MKVDFDQATAILRPAPLIITIGGKDHALRELETGDVMILDTIGKGVDEERDLEFMKGLFAGEAPPIFELVRELMLRLKDLRKISVAKFPALAKLKDETTGKDRAPLSVDIHAACGGKWPEELAEFMSIEHRYSLANLQVSMLHETISRMVLETTPKNSWPAVMENISRQIEAQSPTRSSDSPASALPSPS